jgi:CDP-4-dehydro-6-deoxyglucose reductase, E3
MGFTVKLLPNEQEFVVESNETILEAAVRAGITLNYGCSHGNCGLCKGRVIAGGVEQVRHQDFIFSSVEKLQRYALMCTSTATTDLIIEARLAGEAVKFAVQQFKAKVRRLEFVSDELLILHLRPARVSHFQFLAGQYATLSLPGVGELDSSIASCPCDDKRLEFHIRHLQGEPVSEYCFNSLKPGEWLDIAAPKGDFVLRENSRRPMIMIAFDTGFAAIKSLLEQATAQEKERGIHLYWIACGKEGQYLQNLCRAWQDALDEFQYTPISIADSYKELMARRERGLELIEQKLYRVSAQHPDLSGYDVYITAPEQLLAAAAAIFQRCALPGDQLKQEIVRGNQNVGCLVPDSAGGL